MGAGPRAGRRRRDGSTFPAEISLSAIDTGEGFLVMAAVRDVTERLEPAFVAEEVASRAPQDEWQSVREDIQEIERAAERAAGLTHQLLAFALPMKMCELAIAAMPSSRLKKPMTSSMTEAKMIRP